MVSLPTPGDPDFAMKMRQLDASLSDPVTELTAILEDASKPHEVRFAALYGVLHRFRREYRFVEYHALFKTYEREFSDEPYMETFRVVIARWSGDDPRSLIRALVSAQKAVNLLPRQAGVLHQYAEIVATLAESREDLAGPYVNRAMELVDEAINLSAATIPHFFATRATLFMALGNTESARRDIDRAIEEEPRRGADYARRISRYEATRLLILIRQRELDVDKRHSRLITELDQFKTQQLALLGLLAAVMALIVSSASISTRVDPSEAVRLLAASGGIVAIVFGGVTAALVGTSAGRTVLAVAIGGILLLVAALPVVWQGFN
ncbi:hypothetical protein KIH74_35105 [Kineosporia sp. J2-2]|uniref:Tetratricopeptide repeat protein n=1 Tax=Kineosporia corallincola TaxID=2835133 RepID=A0ABS5TTU0_9ACTN|nr:hypothetical protein [Kineosporia corallincola]MBT0774226.1 hypothetical protein [Kineosporia corallincola]